MFFDAESCAASHLDLQLVSMLTPIIWRASTRRLLEQGEG